MSAPKSRWANVEEEPETEAILAQRKREKEAKRRAKADRQQQQQLEQASLEGRQQPPAKRRRLSADSSTEQQQQQKHLLLFPTRGWGPCRHVDNYERINHIEEGSYGWVSRAKDINTGEIVALKKLKMENSPDGFPVTGLREIQTLLEARHDNIVHLREIVTGNKITELVFLYEETS